MLGSLAAIENTAYAAEKLQVNLHYRRYSGDYEGWNVWSWVGSGQGSSYKFNGKDDYGMVASYTIELGEGEKQIGFIVRHSTDTNEWERKDCNEDRFIDVTRAKNGVIDLYVLQDQSKFGYGAEEMNLKPKITEAALLDAVSIKFKVSAGFDSTSAHIADKFKVTDSDGIEYAVKSVSSKGSTNATEAVLNLVKLPLFKQYTLEFEGYGDIMVSGARIFSTKEFEEAYYYNGNDLGASWSKEKTAFRIWAPTASEVKLNLYKTGNENDLIESIPMNKDVKGTWYIEKTGNQNGVYYTYSVTVNGKTNEAVDPYARAVGVNGLRGMVIDLDSTDPLGFVGDKKPKFVNSTDAVIYELHIRDFSSDASSGIVNKGKYLAFTEKGTKNSQGVKTGLDYLSDLGITHVQLLPSFDYASVDETNTGSSSFNWGYDPNNYNVPEGSYSTDPYHGEVRINEYKQMVQSLHNNGIRVVMDVVFNHTSASADSDFNKIVPGYYYRIKDDGQFSNASGCGNETASERVMVRKFIVDSVVYWATEYHVDGFRFDLMGIHDIETMNEVRKALNKIDPTILVYGEGWTGGASVLPDSERVLKNNMSSVDSKIAAFSDDLRDGVRGSVFDALERGFATGRSGMEESVKFGIAASTKHNQIDYSKVKYSSSPWAAQPTQTINYVSAHDNLTLWDKITSSNASDSTADRIRMNLLSSAIVLTSQGIPFFQAGEEFLRSKPLDAAGTKFDGNSYKSPDSVNSLKWNSLNTNYNVYEYYKGLIAFRKAHAALRMTKTDEINQNLSFLSGLDANVVGYTINNSPNGETAESICIIFNANKKTVTVNIPEGSWSVYVKGSKSGIKVLETVQGGEVTVEPVSALVMVKEVASADLSDKKAASDLIVNPTKAPSKETVKTAELDKDADAAALAKANRKSIIRLFIVVGICIAIIAAGAAYFWRKKSEKKDNTGDFH